MSDIREPASPAATDPRVALPTDEATYAATSRRSTMNDDISAADDDYWDDKKGPGPRVMAADTLKGDDVRNDADEKLGDLSHIMIDVPTGRVAYGVLSVGGFLGMGDKLFAIPWHALKLDPEEHCFRLSVSKDQLKDAPGFDKDAWPSMADQSWATQIHEYYHASPYWLD
jgi:hypothetical protein